jgi:hypothetical protein
MFHTLSEEEVRGMQGIYRLNLALITLLRPVVAGLLACVHVPHAVRGGGEQDEG